MSLTSGLIHPRSYPQLVSVAIHHQLGRGPPCFFSNALLVMKLTLWQSSSHTWCTSEFAYLQRVYKLKQICKFIRVIKS